MNLGFFLIFSQSVHPNSFLFLIVFKNNSKKRIDILNDEVAIIRINNPTSTSFISCSTWQFLYQEGEATCGLY